jgi:hypothetical protein
MLMVLPSWAKPMIDNGPLNMLFCSMVAKHEKPLPPRM